MDWLLYAARERFQQISFAACSVYASNARPGEKICAPERRVPI
jgi:hypothetical protein